MTRLFDERPDSIIGELPAFLKRAPGDSKPAPKAQSTAWWKNPWAKRDRQRRARLAARGDVRTAVERGADTMGKIRKATGLGRPTVRAALRFYTRARVIERRGRRYWMNGRRR